MRAHHRQPGAGAGRSECDDSKEIGKRIHPDRARNRPQMQCRTGGPGQRKQRQPGNTQKPAGAGALMPFRRRPDFVHDPKARGGDIGFRDCCKCRRIEFA
jgi:hypothetical protein